MKYRDTIVHHVRGTELNDPIEKALLLYFASFEGSVSLSLRELETITGWARSTLRKRIKRLEENGLLVVCEGSSGDGRYTANRYTISESMLG